MKRIFEWLGRIGKDKYQHFSLGALIAAVVFCVCVWCGLQFSVATFVSIAGVWVLEIGKEFIFNDRADWRDVEATMLGGVVVWIPICVTYLRF